MAALKRRARLVAPYTPVAGNTSGAALGMLISVIVARDTSYSIQEVLLAQQKPARDGCGRQGYSGTTSYPDLMCTDGYMSDMDADGDDPSVARMPCRACNADEFSEWESEQWENEELPAGLSRRADGALMFDCRSCDEATVYEGEAEDFDINNLANVCGRSERCCP